MGAYLTIPEAVYEASKVIGCELTQVPRKKVMYEGRLRNGDTIILCTPQAKRQPKGFYWVDITEVQYNLLSSYDHATVVFRLEGNRLTRCNWANLKTYLTRSCMKNNANEGNHWKLYIHKDKIEILGNPRAIPLVPCIGTIWEGMDR